MATSLPRRMLLCLGAVLLVTFLVGCGGVGGVAAFPVATATPSPAGATAQTSQLACKLENAAHPIDTISVTLLCTVAQVSSHETGFSLRYTVTKRSGQPYTFLPPCRGALTGGSGQCAQTYSVPALFSFTTGAVSGSTQPHQDPLGPVTPNVAPIVTPNPAVTPVITGAP